MSNSDQAQSEALISQSGCFGLIFLVVVAVALWNGLLGDQSPGRKCVTAFEAKGFSNAEARESYLMSLERGDEFGVNELLASGQVASLPVGSDALVLERKFRPFMLAENFTDPRAKSSAWLVQIRVLSGPYLGEKFWVESASLASRPPEVRSEGTRRKKPDPELDAHGEPIQSGIGEVAPGSVDPLPDPRQKELLKSILDADPSPREVKSQAWNSFMAASDSASFRGWFDSLPLDTMTKRQLYFLKFPQSYGTTPQVKRDIGNNPKLFEYLGVKPMDQFTHFKVKGTSKVVTADELYDKLKAQPAAQGKPRDEVISTYLAENDDQLEGVRPPARTKMGLSTDPSTREYAALRAAEPLKPKDAQPAARTNPPAMDPAYAEFDKKYRLSLPDLATRPIPTGLGGAAPEVGTRRPRRVL